MGAVHAPGRIVRVDLTASYLRVLPGDVLARYEVAEVREAAAVLRGSNPDEFRDVVEVLRAFALRDGDVTRAGGNEGDVAKRLNVAFRERGWREVRHDQVVVSRLRRLPYAPAGETAPTVQESEVISEGYRVDNVKGGVALDVEWNAKDGNLDRDVGAYASLYALGVIRGAVMITRTVDDLRELGRAMGRINFLNTTTTTNLPKLLPRLTRGSAGGCPVLAVAITARCYDATLLTQDVGGAT